METTGAYRICSRCKGTGEARYNHLNGDTHCYLCNGSGLLYRPTAAEKARREADDQWATDAYMALVGGYHSFENKIREPIRTATQTTPHMRQADREALSVEELAAYEAARADDAHRRDQLRRRITFWVGEGLQDMQQAQGEERRAQQAAALAAAKSDPKIAAKIAQAIAAQEARHAELRAAGMIVNGI